MQLRPISANDRRAGKYRHIFRNEGSVLGTFARSETARSLGNISLRRYTQRVDLTVDLKVRHMLLDGNRVIAWYAAMTDSSHPGETETGHMPFADRLARLTGFSYRIPEKKKTD